MFEAPEIMLLPILFVILDKSKYFTISSVIIEELCNFA